MISKKQLTYLKNRIRRGAKPDKLLGWLSPGFPARKVTIREIIRGLRLLKRTPTLQLCYETLVTSRANNIGMKNLLECIDSSATPEGAEALVSHYQWLADFVAKS